MPPPPVRKAMAAAEWARLAGVQGFLKADGKNVSSCEQHCCMSINHKYRTRAFSATCRDAGPDVCEYVQEQDSIFAPQAGTDICKCLRGCASRGLMPSPARLTCSSHRKSLAELVLLERAMLPGDDIWHQICSVWVASNARVCQIAALKTQRGALRARTRSCLFNASG